MSISREHIICVSKQNLSKFMIFLPTQTYYRFFHISSCFLSLNSITINLVFQFRTLDYNPHFSFPSPPTGLPGLTRPLICPCRWADALAGISAQAQLLGDIQPTTEFCSDVKWYIFLPSLSFSFLLCLFYFVLLR